MKLIKAKYPLGDDVVDIDVELNCENHGRVKMNRKSAHLIAPSSGRRAQGVSRPSADAPEGSRAAEEAPKKRSWIKHALEKVLCMNIALHKENHAAYCERRIIVKNQQKIMAALNLPPPPPNEAVQPLVAYKNWNNKYVDWDHHMPEEDDIETGSEAEEDESEATASE